MTHDLALHPSRRAIVGGLIVAGVLPVGVQAAEGARLIAGTYASEKGAGLVPLVADGAGWRTGTAVPAIRNASFGVWGGVRGKLRYLLDEQAKGTVGVYDAALRPLATRSTLGADPCHAALAPDGRMLAVANYSSGSVALYTLDAAGLPIGEAQVVAHQGSGPNTGRQAGPHAHWVGFARDGAILHAVDLGADAVFAHRLDRTRGRIAATEVAYRAAAGSGPRHLARHPRLPIAYLVAELANTVTVLRAARDGTFAEQAVVPTLPRGFGGTSYAAHIALDAAGTRLYVSNRGHDSIVVYAVDRRGDLTLLRHVACGGHWPRFFRLMEGRREMLVANERSGGIARLPLLGDGTLGAMTGIVPLPGVVFLGD